MKKLFHRGERKNITDLGNVEGLGIPFGLVKNFLTNPFSWWDYPEIYKNIYRVTATFGNANNFAGYMEMVISLLLGMFITGIKRPKIIIMVCLVFLFITALIFSFSRGGWISMLFGLVFMAIVLVPLIASPLPEPG